MSVVKASTRGSQAYHHIRKWEHEMDAETAPRELTQAGIAQALDTNRSNASAIMRILCMRGVCIQTLRYVGPQHTRLMKVYRTSSGSKPFDMYNNAVYIPAGKALELRNHLLAAAQILNGKQLRDMERPHRRKQP